MKKAFLFVTLCLMMVLTACNRVPVNTDGQLSGQTEAVSPAPKKTVVNRISEPVSIKGINQGDYGLVKAGAVSEMIADIQKASFTIQDIQTVYSGAEMSQMLCIKGYRELIREASVALRSLYAINERYPVEYINRIDDKTVYAVYKTTDGNDEFRYTYLFFQKRDDTREGVQDNIMTETWGIENVFSIKKALQYSDFSALKVGSAISEVEAVDPLVYANVGRDGAFTEPFHSNHLLTDGILRIEYAFDEADSIYRIAAIEYNASFDVPTRTDGKDSKISVKISRDDYPKGKECNVKCLNPTFVLKSDESITTPDQSYIGVWHTESQPPEEMKIIEITTDTVKFETGLFRQFGFMATARGSGALFIFEDEETKIKGRLEFGQNSVTVMYDSYGDFSSYDIGSNVYQFTVKIDGE